MDTPDKAVSLADSQLADSSNKYWLLASARSNQLTAASLRLDVSLNSNDDINRTNLYGSMSCVDEVNAQPSSWLLRHFAPNSNAQWIGRSGPAGRDLMSANYTINNHIYDNISFADSPILRSLSPLCDNERNNETCDRGKLLNNDSSVRMRPNVTGPIAERGSHKFRFFLASYVLLGITLAIYSRNALSLAAVGMVANNVLNKELADILSASSGRNEASHKLDGACPIPKLEQSHNKGQSGAMGQTSNKSLGQSELKLRSSIMQRIENGELVDWTPGEQGLIFAAGSVGNLLIAIPLTRVGEIYGPKWIIFGAALGATIQAALMPIVATSNVALVIFFQIIFNGLTYGADCVAYTLFVYWLTPTEMAFFVSCLLICYQLGTIISSFATAKILSENVSWGWCFYTPALLCGLWTIVWVLVGASDPTKSRFISRTELRYLLRNSKIAQTLSDSDASVHQRDARMSTNSDQQQVKKQAHTISWLKLARDPNIWAICAVKFTLRWYFSVYLSLMPTYLSSVAHMSVGTIGKMSVVQSFIGLFSGVLMGFLTRSLVTKRPFSMSLATTRKFFQSIVNFGLVISLIVFIIYDCDQWVTIIALTLGGICINFYVAAALQLPLDLSPNHCGLITSITNTLAFGQTLGAPISGLILNKGPKDRSLWQVVWLIAIILNLLSGLAFILLVDTKPRDYNKHSEDPTDCARPSMKRRKVRDYF